MRRRFARLLTGVAALFGPSGPPPPFVWILDGGIWNDSGVWLDSAVWED